MTAGAARKPRIVKAEPKRYFQRPEALMGHLAPLIGQDDLKRKLVSTFSQYTRYLEDPGVGRPTVLVYGPSGAGKTFAVHLLAQACGLPFTEVSAAGLAVQSYKGRTIQDILAQHWLQHKTDEGVIFLDEIDKRCAGAIGRDSELRTTGLAIQSELLRVIEAEDMAFIDFAEDFPALKDVVFETKRILWVLAGAYVGLNYLIRRRLHNQYVDPKEIWKEALEADFIRYGMLPELVFRCQTRAWVKPLEHQEITRIVREQEVPKWFSLFSAIDCELTIDDGALSRIADLAIREKTGARGGLTYLRRSMEDIYVEASKHHLAAVHVDASIVMSGRMEMSDAVE